MSLYYNDAYKNIPEREQWTLLLCGNYALNQLLTKYEKSNSTRLTYRLGCYCSDKRRYPTVIKQFRSLNLITEAYQDSITPCDSEIEKLLPGFSKEPTFNTQGYKKESEYSYSSREVIKPLKEKGEAYRPLSDMNAFEVIYVYLNQDKYDFEEFKHTTSITNKKRYYSTNTFDTYTVKVFPKEFNDTLEDGIIAENIKEYAKKNAREILSTAFKLNLKAIDDNLPYFSIKDLQKRLAEVTNKIRVLEIVQIELQAILMDTESMSEEAYLDKILSAARDYTTAQSPLWIFDDSFDSIDKQALAKILLKGTDLITETKSSR